MTVADSLRAMADFLDQHPDIDVSDQNITLLKYVCTREELADLARRAGSLRKVYTKDYFELHKDCGNGISLHIYTDRSNVCRRVVLGKRVVPAIPAQPEREEDIVQWVCDDEPLLAGVEQ